MGTKFSISTETGPLMAVDFFGLAFFWPRILSFIRGGLRFAKGGATDFANFHRFLEGTCAVIRHRFQEGGIGFSNRKNVGG